MTVTKAKDLLSGVGAVDEVTKCRLLMRPSSSRTSPDSTRR